METAKTGEEMLGQLAAAYHLGITAELLFQYTKDAFAKASGLKALKTVELSGQAYFAIAELNSFDSALAGPWPSEGDRRPAIPKAVLDHLRAESHNQCARCGTGIGVDTAHIRAWADSRSHHHANLIRICSSCHREHDAHNSLSTVDLLNLKQSLVARTRANLSVRMSAARRFDALPRNNPNFFGRHKELSLLIEALSSGRSVIITGVGGAGKTELLNLALRKTNNGRMIYWIDVERYHSASHIIAALQAALGTNGVACPEVDVASRLDDVQACVVFDGIERASLDDIDEFEDTIFELYMSTNSTQFVATSQVYLHKFSADTHLKLGRLDQLSSKNILDYNQETEDVLDNDDLGLLLTFCDGHALTLKLARALLRHYGGANAVLAAIDSKGASAVKLPGRQRQTHGTSLELCLRLAYESLSNGARLLLWALSECPGGMFSEVIENGWLGVPDPLDCLAELRRWHLIDVVVGRGESRRIHILSPIRKFAIDRAKTMHGLEYIQLIDRLVVEHGTMVAVWEIKYDDPNETPYVLQRYEDELPNLLHILDLAKANKGRTDMALTAVAIVRSMMRYFFVRRLPELGGQVMKEAAELALSLGYAERASGLVLQLVGLGARAESEELIQSGLHLAEELEHATSEIRVLADVSLCRGIAAREHADFGAAEIYARQAFEGYKTKLRSEMAAAVADRDRNTADAAEQQDLHSDIANALSVLGFAYYAQGRYAEAANAFRHSLKHESGANVAVNRGQMLHQIGNCESHLGNFRDAISYYVEASEIFHFVGMEEFLSNALGELGYAILDLEDECPIEELDLELIGKGLADLERDVKRVFDLSMPLDHGRCQGILRKLFGTVTLVTLLGQGKSLKEFCLSLKREVVEILTSEVVSGRRANDEIFPLMFADTALMLGYFTAVSEEILEDEGELPQEYIGQLLKAVCDGPEWCRTTMRAIDWLSDLLTKRWRYQGADRTRLREFVKNYDNDIVDWLDLQPKKSAE